MELPVMAKKGGGFALKKWKVKKSERIKRLPINKTMSDFYNNNDNNILAIKNEMC